MNTAVILGDSQVLTVAQLAKSMEWSRSRPRRSNTFPSSKWKDQSDVSVKSLDVERGGFVKAGGKFPSLAVAPGIATAIQPPKGTQAEMSEMVRREVLKPPQAAQLTERVEAAAHLPL